MEKVSALKPSDLASAAHGPGRGREEAAQEKILTASGWMWWKGRQEWIAIAQARNRLGRRTSGWTSRVEWLAQTRFAPPLSFFSPVNGTNSS